MIELVLVVVLSTPLQQSAEGYKGMVPLITQRSEAEKLLGSPNHPCENFCFYEVGDDRIFVRYASEPCSKENNWTVPSGTVIELSVYPGDDPKFSSLKLDRRHFKKTDDPELHGYSWYEDEKAGVTYCVSQKGRVTGIHWYGAAERDQKLRCPTKQSR